MHDGALATPAKIRSAPRLRRFLVADLFCGAGGTSTAAHRAAVRLGYRMELVALNHEPVAIETHRRNHPEARHYCVNLDAAHPEQIVPEGRLDLLLASPECTHHSRARGGKPTHDQHRMSAWHVVRWCTALRVKRLLIENVPEFVEWGPVDPRTGRPVASRKGEYFRAWVNALESIGFKTEWRILNAADYGDATTRMRFFMIGRSDGQRIRWPAPTHAPREKAALLGLQPWRSAREVIDWSLPAKSIFGRKRPLSPKTLARIEAGMKRFAWPEPFFAMFYGRSQPTIAADRHIGLARPFILSQASGGAARGVDEPMPTIPCGGAHSLVTPFIVPVTHDDSSDRARSIDQPLPTITGASRGELALAHPFITPYYGSSRTGVSIDEPLDTVTTKARFGLVEPFIATKLDELSGVAPFVAEIGGRRMMIDIRFRMLEWHELARAMSFSDDETAYEFAGTKTQITKQIGNAVPIRTGTALISTLMED